jgi:drug/metabolite transporter (DMT)-like permease
MRAYGSNWRLGILITCLCFFLFTVMDICIKWVGNRCPVMESFLILAGTAAVTIAIPTWVQHGLSGLKTHHPQVHLLRGITNFASFLLVIYALPRVTLANFYALIFALPLFLTVLSALFLREPTGRQRWLATMVGFVGVLVVLRPSLSLNLGELGVLACSVLYSITIILMRYTDKQDSSAAIMFWMLVVPLPVAFALTVINFVPLGFSDIAWLVLSGVLYGSGNLALAEGFRLASTPVAAPFHYTQLLWGIPLGYFIWHEIPDAYTWIGGAVIVASGLYLLRHESRVEKVIP